MPYKKKAHAEQGFDEAEFVAVSDETPETPATNSTAQTYEVRDTVLVLRDLADMNLESANTRKRGDTVTAADFESPALFQRYLDVGAIAPVKTP